MTDDRLEELGEHIDADGPYSGHVRELLADLEAERAAHARTTQALRDAVSAKACWVPRAIRRLRAGQ